MLQEKISGSIDEYSDIIKFIFPEEDCSELFIILEEAIKDQRIKSAQEEKERKAQERMIQQHYGAGTSRIRSSRHAGLIDESTIEKGTNRERKFSLSFHTFLQVVFNFQLSKHEQFIAPLRLLYKKIDTNNHGFISRNQFLSLIALLQEASIEGEYINSEEFLDRSDPFNTNIITFTACVSAMHNIIPKIQSVEK